MRHVFRTRYDNTVEPSQTRRGQRLKDTLYCTERIE